jgi:curved DNA-binding protein CbpA
MPDPYTTLGVPPDTDDETVRRRYLELTREFPPEQHPEKSAAVRSAYEKLRTADARARHRLFEAWAEDTMEALIEEATCRTPRPRPGLAKLTAAVFATPR